MTLAEGKLTHPSEAEAREAFATLSSIINAGSRAGSDLLADLIMHEHPTLSGYFARATALGIMRRSVREEDFKAFDSWEGDCELSDPLSTDTPRHPMHDGRHSCRLVVGAMLMAQGGVL